jgi:hypothetical protein
MKRAILLLLFSIFIYLSFSQNLVPNPSFEDHDTCPYQFNQFNYVKDWISCTISCDYYNTCDTNPNSFGIPLNCMGYQNTPDGGNAYAGFIPSGIGYNYREFIGCKLLNNLVANQKYYLSFKVSASNYTKTFINNIGMLFSNQSYFHIYPTWPGDSVLIKNFSHLHSYSIITDTLNWITIKGTFIADSAYQYLIIGNFYDDNHTDTLMTGTINSSAYYYIDEVCVSTDSLTCYSHEAINEISKNEELVNIFPNPATNNLTIESPQSAVIEITNIQGQLIKNLVASSNKTYVDISTLPSGVYILEVKTEKGIAVKKFLKE